MPDPHELPLRRIALSAWTRSCLLDRAGPKPRCRTTNRSDPPSRATPVALVASILGFGLLMALRSQVDAPWQRILVAACAGALLGTAILLGRSYWAYRKSPSA